VSRTVETTCGAPRRLPARLAAALGTDTLAAAALLGGLVFANLRPVRDPDLWWHLAAGEWILDGLGVPWTDPFSHVAYGNPWIAYSWLPEVVFAWGARTAGVGALVVGSALLVACVTLVVLRTCRAAGARPTVALLATALAAGASAACWSVRPHLVSFLCMAVFVHVLVRDRGEPAPRVGRLWWLVPTMLLWANSHILFPFGGVLLALDVAGRPRVWASRPRVAILAAVGAVTFATPYGWRLHEHVLVMMRQPVAYSLVTEFQTPTLHELHGVVLAALFFVTAAAVMWSPLRRDPVELGGFFLFAWLAFTMARNMPFFAIVAAPVLGRHLDALLARPRPPAPAPGPVAAGVHLAVLVAAALALAVHARALLPADAALDRRFPRDAVRWLRTNGPPGRLFNAFDWGGYLIYTLRDRYAVSMDGRTQVYGEKTLAEFKRFVTLAPDWRTWFDRVDPDVVLWNRDGAFARVLELMPEWRRAYEDDVAVIWVRTRPAPDDFVATFRAR
jgi:hypothetical protein